MKVFRITKEKYKGDLSGKGAELFGGRWNPVGTPALYTSENRALCTLELLVHTTNNVLPSTYLIQSIEIPKKLEKEIKLLSASDLSPNWNTLEHEVWTEELGYKYLHEEKKLGIQIPSAIIPQENNFVLNPNHESYEDIKIVQISELHIDKRLLK
ncbi:MAG: RES domain-containing protein [Polaribacter sp.]|jgi:RES domain-containing protein